MLPDIAIMFWKEWKELIRLKGGSRSGAITILIMVLVFGIMMPIQFGRMWVDSAASLSMWVIIPLILITSIVADSFAGERERQTLETLLASRLPDMAILLGKLGTLVAYVWIATQLVFITALIPLNIIHGKGEILVYSLEVALSGMVLSFLLTVMMSCIGILVSLKSATVKQAQQILGLAVFIFAYAVPMAAVYGLRFLPDGTRNVIFKPILEGNVGGIVLMVSGVLIFLNVGLLAITKLLFQRNRLISNL